MQYFTGTSKSVLIFAVLIAIVTSTSIAGQGKNLLLNAGAEEGKGDLPSLWFKAAIPAEGLKMYRDTQNVHSGKFSLAISNTHKYDQTVCNNWAQNLQNVPVGKVIKVSAYIKTENADSVNVCVQCWGLDDSEKMLAFTSTNILRGDSNWILLESPPVVVPAGTAKITVRAVLTGLGKAWFDDVGVDMIDMPSEMSSNISAAQVGDKKYDQKQIQEKNAEVFFERIGDPESGYHGFSGLWALIEKAKISDAKTKEKIIIKAGEIIKDPNQTPFRRWQCCYVISGIGDANGIPSLVYALTKDKDTTVRGCAACALGKFTDEQAVDALKQAKITERNQEVLDWINKALDGQFLKN
jgi:hypothetical protein